MPEAEQQEGAAGAAAEARLGGAAADFVAGLGRKVSELRASLDALAEAPERARGRDELRRKLHALGVGARLLQFEVLAKAIADATERIDDEASQGTMTDALLDDLSALLLKIPDLAWAKKAPTPTPPPAQDAEPLPDVPPPTMPWTVLVVGAESLGNVVGGDSHVFPCEVERVDDPKSALDLARAVAPEVVVIDVDLDGAIELIESLVEDPLTMPVPIVALGTMSDPSLSSRLVALGVTKAVTKPSSPSELRSICAALVDEVKHAAQARMHPELGSLSVIELADRLADEVRRALLSEIDPSSSGVKVSFGVGAEILGPMWGALARVRDVVQARSKGSVVFHGDRARGPIAIASALIEQAPPVSLTPPDSEDEQAASERRVQRPRGADLQIDLASRIIVIADDDPQVVWFMADVLRSAGALVLEAKDGGEALALARGSGADAIVSDVLMPRVDGLTLARTLRRDVALRDRPIVLLSWKEDLLKRLRDLRMESHAMLRKEADGRTILARVREVLAPRIRVESRIATSGEVRGRLDELSVASLLEITNRVRREASIVVRDAASVFEIELDGGGIRSASRASIDGALVQGLEVIPSLLGVVGGRFLVRGLSPIPTSPRDLEGDLVTQLAPVLRRVRAACDALSGAHTVEVALVGLEPALLAAYLRATPPPVRALIERIAKGASPREMILGGEVAPATLEDVLIDVASRGIVTKALGESGEDLLAIADRALDAGPQPLVMTDEQRKSRPPSHAKPPPEAPGSTMNDFTMESVPPPPMSPKPEVDSGAHPSSIGDAVLQASAGEKQSSAKPIIDTRDLKPRSVPTRSDPPPGAERSSIPSRDAPAPEAELAAATSDASKTDDPAVGTMPPPARAPSPPPQPAAAPVESSRVNTLIGIVSPIGEARDEEPKVEAKPEEPKEPEPAPAEAKAPAKVEAKPQPRDDEDPPRGKRRRDDERDEDDDEDARAAKRRRRAADRVEVPPEKKVAAAKQLRKDGAFWWIVIALVIVALSVGFYVQQQEESHKAKPAASSAPAQPKPPSSSPSP